MSRVRVVQQSTELPQRIRQRVRDGWRVFRSRETGYQIAIPTYQIRRVEAIGKRERDEWYALVVGELCRDDDGVHAVVRDLIPNEWAERGRAHVHIGAGAEVQVRRLASDLHPDLVPLGNLHTHPRYGTRPSGTDRAEFWSDPHSVSIIVDPSDRPTLGVYRGREGEKLEELADAASPPTLRAPTTPVHVNSPAVEVSHVRETRRVHMPWVAVAALMACLSGVVSIFIGVGHHKDVDGAAELNARLEARIASLEATVTEAERRGFRRGAEERSPHEQTQEHEVQCLYPEP